MPLLVRFKPGAENAARLIGLPMTLLQGRGYVVREPLGWSQRELESHVVRSAGPYLASIGSVTMSGALGGCNCMGRRS